MKILYFVEEVNKLPRIKILKEFVYKPSPQKTRIYEEGKVYLVESACSDKAIAGGFAEITTIPAPKSGIVQTINKTRRKQKNE